MKFLEFFKNKQEKERKTEKDPEISLISIEELNKKLYSPLTNIELQRQLLPEENEAILKEIISTYSNFPEDVKKLFRYKTFAIYYLPNEWNLSGLTSLTALSSDKAVIIINAKSIKRGITITLLHELSHCLDFNTYPPMYTPKWAWEFLDRFENFI